MRIDSHMHVWSFGKVEYYHNLPLLNYMERLKLDKSALISVSNKENSQVSNLISAYPDKFFGIAYIDRGNLELSLSELTNGISMGIYKGIKVLSYQGGYHVDDDIQMRIYERCLELDIPVLFHVGWHNSGDVNPSDAASGSNSCKYSCLPNPVELGNILETFPKMKVVFAHMGAEHYFQCLGIAQRFHNVYLDTAWLDHYGSSLLPRITVRQWVEHACNNIGSARILYGGEYTLPSEIEACNITEEDKENILGKNCRLLYKL